LLSGNYLILIYHKSGEIIEKLEQCLLAGSQLVDLIEGGGHVFDPGIALGLTDFEGQMPRAHTGMTALVAICCRAAGALDKKLGQMLFGIAEVVRIHRTQERILLNARIKLIYEFVKRGITGCFVHGSDRIEHLHISLSYSKKTSPKGRCFPE
jgi:hypothetical protein